ncbi:MAG: helix-turn-helix domain-containing protein [Dehalococcoidia bacterium]|nr:helix-turn-helix domain-containing protein [Dehalococcoidia bacterium]
MPFTYADGSRSVPETRTGTHADPLTGLGDPSYPGDAHEAAGARIPPAAARPVAHSQLTPNVSPRIGPRTAALLTVEEVGERLRLSRTSVYRLVERRQLPFFRLPGSLRFSTDDMDAFLAARRVETIDRQHL